jgi:CBS domain containing-hemolysin-like protein
MENKKHFSLSAFIGKTVLKIAFIVLLFMAVQKILSKFFKKTLSVSVELNDVKPDEPDTETEEGSDDEEDDELAEESESKETTEENE